VNRFLAFSDFVARQRCLQYSLRYLGNLWNINLPDACSVVVPSWADRIHAKMRLEDAANRKRCMLVLMGVSGDGENEFIAILDGCRKSEQSCRGLLLDLESQGVASLTKLVVGGDALHIWAGLREIYP
jgi:hypothetical protein